MQTTYEPDVTIDYVLNLLDGKLIFRSPVSEPKFNVIDIPTPVLHEWCWLILDINELSEIAYSNNNLRSQLALLAIRQFNATMQTLKSNFIFQDCGEQTIINTVHNLCNRLDLISDLKRFARQEIRRIYNDELTSR